MTYQVLARKWRPQDFSSLVGQEPIITALRNGLSEGRIAQAYLFSGIRGVGKTTAARVLAKALNCENGPAADPCNECASCLEITAGNDIDVLEIDAATYSKVEQVRELTESLRYTAARDRYKVVVLDEVHRLSRQAFDALLKIVEEPPPHLVFIFATTEIDAVPATILSRCQEFQFRRVSSPVLAEHLRRISEAESIEVSDTALRLIARAGEGSVRDSVALLDQLATFGSSTISDQDASNLLGGLDTAIFRSLLEAILDGEPAPIRDIVREIEANGWDPNNVFGQFLTYCRDALHLAMGAAAESVDLPREEAETLAELVTPRGYESLLLLTQHLLASEPTVRRSELGNLALEIAWLRAAELPKVTRIQDLLSGRITETPPESSSPGRSQASRPRKPPPSPPGRALSKPPARPESVSPPSSNQGGAERIPDFLDLLSTRRPSLAAHFTTEVLSFENGQLLIRLADGDRLLKSALERQGNVETVEALLQEVWGNGTAWTLATSRDATPAPPSPNAVEDAEVSQAVENVEAQAVENVRDDVRQERQHPTVQAVLDIFGGEIRSVQPGSKES